ncbi:hypothetical protein CEXT_204761 [Caerostris extrusa]|uniref:Uncharacterized protein n=1 Tax=Caerostris extrusa TaxID=172846 RepID=A0AAV4VJP0_CAEEX|nr:hypothetical protein CEXT_204761 [Caerostris extrusa]
MSRPDSRLAIKVNRWTNRSRRVHQKYEECHRRRFWESSHSHELGREPDIRSKKLQLLPDSDGIYAHSNPLYQPTDPHLIRLRPLKATEHPKAPDRMGRYSDRSVHIKRVFGASVGRDEEVGRTRD